MRYDRYRTIAATPLGIMNSISQNSQFTGRPPNVPSEPPDERFDETSSTTPGSTKAFALFANANRTDAGCNRCSDAIGALPRQQVLPYAQGNLMVEPHELHLRVVRACRVDDERTQTEP